MEEEREREGTRREEEGESRVGVIWLDKEIEVKLQPSKTELAHFG